MLKPSPKEILKKYWGFEEFRSIQGEVIESIIGSRDALALMPTGGGKSLCYQVPALCMEGCCVVISPLIALMQDQVNQLKQRGVTAEFIHSGLRYKEVERILDQSRRGANKLLYVSPERLLNQNFRESIINFKISFIAVDEAHCISQWGYDFRPAYLKINEFRSLFNCPILALTATATDEVQLDILKQLGIPTAKIFKSSFKRENLSLVVREQENKSSEIVHILKKLKTSALVYVRNRRQTVEICNDLQREGISAGFYHAGLPVESRNERQKSWIENKIRVMVCTNAFGMGVDKSDVSVVIHADLPNSLEEYFQEVGRAGRNGSKAYGVLLYHQKDIRRIQIQYEISFPSIEEIRYVYQCLSYTLDLAVGSTMVDSVDFDLVSFCNRYKLELNKTIGCLKNLEQSGYLYLSEAFHHPSQMQILVSSEELFGIYEGKPQIEILIKSILRLYEGIFSVTVKIQELQLSKITGLSNKMIINILTSLHHSGIIKYLPQSDNPRIQLLLERIPSKEIDIDEQWLKIRKSAFNKRVNSLLEYLSTSHCRQFFIMNYFGENRMEDCGICDNCIGRKNSTINSELKTEWKKFILQKLETKSTMILVELFHLFPSNKKEEVELLLEELIGEKLIERKYDQLFFRKPK
ncbi:MAG: RecQ family ATP-dependent DNA helicase [Saprospiraceae bacterium]|nr:RecQ family ATP-dependent DNA helicase [Candidatus Vicinibacter affinis]